MSAVMEKTDFALSTEDATKYLRLYVGEADWKKHLGIRYERLQKKYPAEEAREMMRKQIAFTILVSTHDKSKLTDPPENLFFWGPEYTQYNDRDWIEDLRVVIEHDKEIEQWRNQSLSLGIVYPIEYSPVTRQAYNWLFGKAEDAGVITPENKKDIAKKFENLVVAYGGNVICYLFMKEEYKINKKVHNWRSNYFFERLIFDTYTVDQVLKIKKQELLKTNSKLVKTVRLSK